MIISHKMFINYIGQHVHLVLDTWLHIEEKHPEIDFEIIKETLADPDVVFLSEANINCELYFLQKTEVDKKIRF
jgi:hypothetical protein